MGSKSRTESREIALQVLYQAESAQLSADEAIRLFQEHLAKRIRDEQLVRTWVEGVLANLALLDDKIDAASEHWRPERMPKVDLNILRLATYELMHFEDEPVAIIVNEAIELAKRFGSEQSSRFVNGVLDRIARDLAKT